MPSPDGRWLAYISNESGSEALYVRPITGESQNWLLKGAGAYRPRWTRGGRELPLNGADGEMLSVSVGERPSFRTSGPRVLFRLPDTPDVVLPVFEDVTPDGEQLLLNVPVKPASSFGFRVSSTGRHLWRRKSRSEGSGAAQFRVRSLNLASRLTRSLRGSPPCRTTPPAEPCC